MRDQSTRRPWTEQEDRILREHPDASHSAAAAMLGRSPKSVMRRRAQLGLRLAPTPRRWSEAEDAYLRQSVGRMPVAEIAATLGRRQSVVSLRISRLGLDSRPPLPIAEVSDVDLAWAAGLFEGEGTVTIQGTSQRPHTRIVASVANTDKRVIDFFQARWPALRITTRMPSGAKNARLVYEWRVNSRQAARFLRAIQPFIRTDRVERKIALALEAQEHRRQGARNTAEYRTMQQGYRQQMAALNKRGA